MSSPLHTWAQTLSLKIHSVQNHNYDLPPLPAFLPVNPISVNGSSIFPAAQIRNLGVLRGAPNSFVA